MPEAARHERAAETRSLVGREDEWEVEVERQAARETAVEQRVERKARRGAGTGAEFMKVQEGGAVKPRRAGGGADGKGEWRWVETLAIAGPLTQGRDPP
ncbi:MAG: hypothetical protein DVB22_001874 [Verrucomicrobia bacterium]|jgi:hypothetical protein|nr:MAG: hypothetical protein DVB22_001874 [Verrucomicrobiota bacterium]